MQTAGIVAEFNPFHRGHQALIQSVRGAGATHVVAVMSGTVVQRGTFSVADKHLRTRCALAGGVDLVLELPLPYACASAQHFARGAITLLQAAGCVDTLCFGSECGDASRLEAMSLLLDSRELSMEIRPLLQQGMTFAKARQLAVEQLHGPEAAALLASPNNLLALEYLNAARNLGWQPHLHTLQRVGAAHDASEPHESTASSTFLRTHATNFDLLHRYVPEPCAALLRDANENSIYPANPARLETAVLACLRRLSPAQLHSLPDLSEGLENRLYHAIRSAATLEELYDTLKTKRYTHARVRRLVLHAFLSITRQDLATPPPYLRILGFNTRGRELIARMKRSATLPVGVSTVRLRTVSPAAARLCLLEEQAADLFSLTLPKPLPCGMEQRSSVVKLI